MNKRLILSLTLLACLLVACPPEPWPTPDLVATQIAVEDAAHATMTARVPTATQTPEPAATPVPTITPSPAPTVTPPPAIEAEEYAVYSALIQQNPIGYDLGAVILVRTHTSADDEILERTLEEIDPLPAGLAESFRSRNAVSYNLDPALVPGQDYTLLPVAEYDEIFGPRRVNWSEFQARYPGAGGLLLFSRVGFATSADSALVTMGFRCGDLCAAGGLYLLDKVDGVWTVRQALMEWMS